MFIFVNIIINVVFVILRVTNIIIRLVITIINESLDVEIVRQSATIIIIVF